MKIYSPVQVRLQADGVDELRALFVLFYIVFVFCFYFGKKILGQYLLAISSY